MSARVNLLQITSLILDIIIGQIDKIFTLEVCQKGVAKPLTQRDTFFRYVIMPRANPINLFSSLEKFTTCCGAFQNDSIGNVEVIITGV